MTQFIAFGCEVGGVVGVNGGEERDLVDDGQVEAAEIESFGFLGIVGEEADFFEA